MISTFIDKYRLDVNWIHYYDNANLTEDIAVSPFLCSQQRSVLVPNGYYSDLILLIWGLVSLFWVWQGMWKTVFVSFLVIVSILKVVDLVGRKFGYNILRTSQEMSFYPIRLLISQDKRHSITFHFQHTDSNSFKLHTSKGICLQSVYNDLGRCSVFYSTILGLFADNWTDEAKI